jgi:hypothetical protein
LVEVDWEDAQDLAILDIHKDGTPRGAVSQPFNTRHAGLALLIFPSPGQPPGLALNDSE